MKKYLLLLLCIILLQTQLNAQVGISATNSPPNASAMLDVSSTTKGFLAPRMTAAQRLAITPVLGLLVFDTNTKSYWYCSFIYTLGGTTFGTWSEIPNKQLWELNGLAGNEISNTNTGGFWSKNAVGLSSASSNDISNPPIAPISGAGTRIMWIPSRSAFRVGTVDSSYPTFWDAANIGLFSFASGYNTKANGSYSVALGTQTIASGFNSTALGAETVASGYFSLAMGVRTIASGSSSMATGVNSNASGITSTAIGDYANATGNYATAIGSITNATGDYALAMGRFTTASGIFSTSLGSNANTNNKSNSFAIGSSYYSSSSRATNDKDYQMKMHFNEFQFLTGSSHIFIINDGGITTDYNTQIQSILSVTGTGGSTISNYGYLSNTAPTGIYSGSVTIPYSIYATSRVLGLEFNAFSDARHKKLRSYSNGKTDLSLLNQLKVSNYTFIDTVGKGIKMQMGFIAQQVEEIVPEAVNKIQDYIPSVYDMAKSMVYDASLHTLTISTYKPHDFQAKDEIKLISLDKEHKVKVAQIIDANTFIVNNWEKSVDKIFVFGKRVDDFRTVDYDRLFTLGISSIQELSKRVEQLEKENGMLKSESKAFNQMKSDIAELKAMIVK